MISLFTPKGNYNVLATDYTTFTIVYSCTSFLFFKLEYAWILSRERNFRNTEKFNQVMEMAVNDYGFKTKNLIRCEQDDCKVDFTRERKNGELKPV